MIVKLPIVIGNKNSYYNFIVRKENDIIIISTFDNKNKVIAQCHNNYGIYKKVIKLPLYLKIINNYLYCEHFFYLIICDKYEFDFFKILLDNIKIINKKYNYIDYKNINTQFIKNEFENYSNYNIYENVNSFIGNTLERVIFLFNYYMFINFYSIENLKSKRTNIIINIINNININYNGTNKSIQEHIKTNKLELFNIIFILNELDILKKIIPKFYKNNKNYSNFLNYYYYNKNDYLIYLKLLEINVNNIEDEYKIYLGDNIINTFDNLSYEFFIEIVSKDNKFNLNILNDLISRYNNYPLTNNKRDIDEQYRKILFYTYKFISDIKKITNFKIFNNKIKYIYGFFIDFFYNIKNNNNFNNIFTSKIYSNNMLYNIFKIIILDFDINVLNQFNKNKVIYSILKKLKLENIKNNYSYLKYLIKNNINIEKFKDIIDINFYNIIINPIILFNRLDKLEDFNLWIETININNLFYNMIKLKNTDYKILARLLYLYKYNYNEFLKESYYNINLITYIVRNKTIINIKFNEIFNKNNNILEDIISTLIISF